MFTRILERVDFLRKLIINSFFLIFIIAIIIGLFIFPFINNIPRNPHLGLDIASNTGTPIYSAEKGLIILARDFFYRGKNILIDHAYNFKTSYSHLDKILVNEGDFVERGEIIGYMGSSGRVTGPHLHFETIFLGEKLNPVYFLSID